MAKAANDLIILKLLTWFVADPSTRGDQWYNNHNEKWFHMRNQWFDLHIPFMMSRRTHTSLCKHGAA